MWFDVWRGNLVFSLIGIYVVDSSTSSALCSKVAHLATIEAWSFGFVWLVCLDHVYFILGCIVFIVLSGISSRLAWSIVKPISVVKTIIGKPRASYVHWDWGVIVLSVSCLDLMCHLTRKLSSRFRGLGLIAGVPPTSIVWGISGCPS